MSVPAVRTFLADRSLSPTGVDRMLPAAMRVMKASPEIAIPELLYTPGRVELVGKHTDYGGGASLVMAVEAGIMAAAVPGGKGTLRLDHLEAGETVVFQETRAGWEPEGSSPFWARYPQVLLNRLLQDNPGLKLGGVLRFSSALPEASGLSSSTAFLITLFHGFVRLRGPGAWGPLQTLILDRQLLASYLSAVEAGRRFAGLGGGDGLRPEGMGTDGGTQDQAAILLARPRELLHLGYRPLQVLNRAPLPDSWMVAVASSGVVARKAGEVREAFNQLSGALGEAWQQWRRTEIGASERELADVPHLGAVVARHPAMATDPGAVRWAEEGLQPRIRQFAAETLIRVPATLRSLRDGDGEGAAKYINASHEDAAAVLQHGVPQTDILVQLARQHGAVAASAFGAGFGGSVWALIPAAEAELFTEQWREAYRAAYPEYAETSTFFVSPPGPGAYAGDGRPEGA